MSVNQFAITSETSGYSTHAHLSTMLFYLQSVLSLDQQNWLLTSIADVTQGDDGIEAMATRVIRYTAIVKQNIPVAQAELSLPLYGENGSATMLEMSLSHWSLNDVARLALVAVALTGTDANMLELLEKIYDFSDHSERKSLVRGLYWLSDAPALPVLAERVQRTNAVDEFCALAQHNPLPAKRYSDKAFNQLVLKSLFLKLNIDRIYGFEQRCNSNLARMCENYMHELHVAHREIPASLWLALNAKDSSAATLEVWGNALGSQIDEQRYYAVKSVHNEQARGDGLLPYFAGKISERAEMEEHPVIFALVQEICTAI